MPRAPAASVYLNVHCRHTGIPRHPVAVAELLQPAGCQVFVCIKSPSPFRTRFPGGKGREAQYSDELCPLCKPCSSCLRPWGSCPNSALITESPTVCGVTRKGQPGGIQLEGSALHGRGLLGTRDPAFYSWPHRAAAPLAAERHSPRRGCADASCSLRWREILFLAAF